MKISCKKIAAAVLVALSMPLFAYADIEILHTNDIHCGISKNLGLARVAQYKKDRQKENPAVILVDAGDAIQGEPIGKRTKGEFIVKVMNAANYDFQIPGNHEYDYGMDNFLKVAKDSACGYYSANFMDLAAGERVFPSWKMFSLDGKKVALIALTTPETLVTSNPVNFQNDRGEWIYGFQEDETGEKLYSTVQTAVGEVKEQGADYVILVAHLGSDGSVPVWSSGAVIANTTGIDAVIDGHSHEQYTRVVTNKEGHPVVLAQTGTKLETLGKIVIDDEGHIAATLLKELGSEEPTVAAMIAEENQKVDEELARKVGTSTVEFVTDIGGVRRVRTGETNLGDMCADAIRELFHADVGLANGGSLRDTLPAQELTAKDLMEVYPFGNMLTLREISGQQLLDALEMGASEYPEENGSFLQVSGLTYTIDATIPSTVQLDDKGRFVGVAGERRVKNVMVGGKPLDPEGDYRVAGSSFLMKDGGDGMTMFDGSYLLSDAEFSDLDSLESFIEKRGGTIGEGYENPEGQGRITILK